MAKRRVKRRRTSERCTPESEPTQSSDDDDEDDAPISRLINLQRSSAATSTPQSQTPTPAQDVPQSSSKGKQAMTSEEEEETERRRRQEMDDIKQAASLNISLEEYLQAKDLEIAREAAAAANPKVSSDPPHTKQHTRVVRSFPEPEVPKELQTMMGRNAQESITSVSLKARAREPLLFLSRIIDNKKVTEVVTRDRIQVYGLSEIVEIIQALEKSRAESLSWVKDHYLSRYKRLLDQALKEGRVTQDEIDKHIESLKKKKKRVTTRKATSKKPFNLAEMMADREIHSITHKINASLDNLNTKCPTVSERILFAYYESPEKGIFFKDKNDVWRFFRESEIVKASIDFLLELKFSIMGKTGNPEFEQKVNAEFSEKAKHLPDPFEVKSEEEEY